MDIRALLPRHAAANAGNDKGRARQVAHVASRGRGQRSSSDATDGRIMQAENEQRDRLGPAARHRSISPRTPRSRSPSVDSEADVVPAARRFAVAWGLSIARHWASGSQGRAARPPLVLRSADSAALDVQRERVLRSDASHVVSPQRNASEVITDNQGEGDISGETRRGHAGSGGEASKASAPVASAGAVVLRSPLRSARQAMSMNAADGGAAASSQSRCAVEAGQLGGGTDASSDSPEVCPVPTWGQQKRRRNAGY